MSVLRKIAGQPAIYGLCVSMFISACEHPTGISGAWEEQRWTKDKWHFSNLEFADDGTYRMHWAPAGDVECGTALFQWGQIDTTRDSLRIRSDFTGDTLRWHYSIVGDSLILTGADETRILHRADRIDDPYE